MIRVNRERLTAVLAAASIWGVIAMPADAQPKYNEVKPTSANAETMIEQAQRHLQRERGFNLDQMLKEWEQGYIEAAMKLTRGNVSQAAKMLGVNRTTLYSRMEALQKEPADK